MLKRCKKLFPFVFLVNEGQCICSSNNHNLIANCHPKTIDLQDKTTKLFISTMDRYFNFGKMGRIFTYDSVGAYTKSAGIHLTQNK